MEITKPASHLGHASQAVLRRYLLALRAHRALGKYDRQCEEPSRTSAARDTALASHKQPARLFQDEAKADRETAGPKAPGPATENPACLRPAVQEWHCQNY